MPAMLLVGPFPRTRQAVQRVGPAAGTQLLVLLVIPFAAAARTAFLRLRSISVSDAVSDCGGVDRGTIAFSLVREETCSAA